MKLRRTILEILKREDRVSRQAVKNAEPGNVNSALVERLRARRKDRGLTMQQVADQAGLSVGFISQIERGITTPSLSSLVSVSRVLGLHVSEFLAGPKGDKAQTRHDNRPVFSIDENSLTYERLSSTFPGSMINMLIIHEPPGHRSELTRHDGEELFYILEGELTVEVDGKRTLLKAGDTLHFDSQLPHSSWNHTSEQTTILHTCTMDVFGDRIDADGNHIGNSEMTKSLTHARHRHSDS